MEPLKKCIDLIGFPMDLGADRRGVDMGPSAILLRVDPAFFGISVTPSPHMNLAFFLFCT